MTATEQAVVNALRLSAAAASALMPTIQQNTDAGKAELIRSGVSAEVVEAGGALVTDTIVMFCLVRMGEQTDRDWFENAFRTQQDNLRKSGK